MTIEEATNALWNKGIKADALMDGTIKTEYDRIYPDEYNKFSLDSILGIVHLDGKMKGRKEVQKELKNTLGI